VSPRILDSVNATLLAALAEPNRLRIIELLGAAPRSVGEIAAKLRLRQPQVTKHLQTLERAGLVTAHPLGQRRIYALQRGTLRELGRWLAKFEVDLPSEDALQQYQAAIEAEHVLAELGQSATPRRLAFKRELPAPASRVWRAWTSADEVRQWWAPAHFTVVECTVTPVVGGRLRTVMAEGDGARYTALGRFLALRHPAVLSFELAPLDDQDEPLFRAVHHVRLADQGSSTRLSLTIRVTDAGPDAMTALAGMQIGWEQLLDKLAALIDDGGSPSV